LPFAHDQLAARKPEVLDAQPHALHQAKPAAVEQRRHQPFASVELREHRAHLVARQHDRQPRRTPRAPDVVHPRQLHPDHLAVEEQQRRERLILRRWRNRATRSEIRQKRLDLPFPQRARVPPAICRDEATHPSEIRILRPDAEPKPANPCAQRLEQRRRALTSEALRVVFRLPFTHREPRIRPAAERRPD